MNQKPILAFGTYMWSAYFVKREGEGEEKREKKKRRKRRRGFILFIFKPCIITMGFIIAINFQGQLMKNDEE